MVKVSHVQVILVFMGTPLVRTVVGTICVTIRFSYTRVPEKMSTKRPGTVANCHHLISSVAP